PIVFLGALMAPSRFSMTMHSTPRWPRSQASPSPTGPAPTMLTDVVVSACMRRSRLLDLDVRGATCLADRLVLLAHIGGERAAAAAGRVERLCCKLRLDIVG